MFKLFLCPYILFISRTKKRFQDKTNLRIFLIISLLPVTVLFNNLLLLRVVWNISREPQIYLFENKKYPVIVQQ